MPVGIGLLDLESDIRRYLQHGRVGPYYSSKAAKNICVKGKKQVGAVTSAERGLHATVVACVSAARQYVPPALIFPRKILNPNLYDRAPPGTLRLCQESGYMTSDLFFVWLKHFCAIVKCTKDDPVLPPSHFGRTCEPQKLRKHLLCIGKRCDSPLFTPSLYDAFYSQEISK